MKFKLIQPIIDVAKITFKGVGNHSIMTYAASIAFYTIFSLPGLLITTITVAGLFVGPEAVTGELSMQLSSFIGNEAAKSVENIIKQIELSGDLTIETIIGVGTLLFSATTIFISLQDALNTIWDVRATPKRGFIKLIINRLISLGMIISLGFILLVSLLIDTVLELFFTQLQGWIGKEPSLVLDVISGLFTFGVVFLIIALIFKMLPDVQLKWKDVSVAAALSTGLFILGKWGIAYYIENSNFTQTYETAGSIIVLLIWVYYSTIVVLFGAEIMRAIKIYRGHPIRPSENAKKVKVKEVDYDTYVEELSN